MAERMFLKERVKKREELQKSHHLKKLQNRPGQIIGTAPAPENRSNYNYHRDVT